MFHNKKLNINIGQFTLYKIFKLSLKLQQIERKELIKNTVATNLNKFKSKCSIKLIFLNCCCISFLSIHILQTKTLFVTLMV